MVKAKQPKADVTSQVKEEGATEEVVPTLIDKESDVSAKKDKEKSKSPKTKYTIYNF